MRSGVLIHAETVAPYWWPPLADLVVERGGASFIRAYADWSSSDVAGWLPLVRRHGIQLRHQFRARPDQDPALIELAMDAIELPITARLDEVMMVGDLRSALPLIQRLRERGLYVLHVGPPTTPFDIRDGCSEFIDVRSLEPFTPEAGRGRHRA